MVVVGWRVGVEVVPFVGEDQWWLRTVLVSGMWCVIFEVVIWTSDHEELLGIGWIEEIVVVVERRFHG